jgi:hypothetical protein
MSALNDATEIEFVNFQFRTATLAKPTAWWVALFTTSTTDAGGGTEVTGGSYARINVPPLDANWNAPGATDGKTANTSTITFPTPSATWGNVVSFALMTLVTVGVMKYHGALTAPKTINNGDPAPVFDPGSLTVTFA